MALLATSGIMNRRGFRSAPVSAGGSAAPTGINVATTTDFVVEFYGLAPLNSYFSKTSSTRFASPITNEFYMEYNGTHWYIWDFQGKYPSTRYNNTSATDPLFIPSTGWNGTSFFYTTTSPTIPMSTNSFIITSPDYTPFKNELFVKYDANNWFAQGGNINLVGSSLGTWSINIYNGKYNVEATRAKALSSGIPTRAWAGYSNLTFTPQ
jgi:hypothetical protein